MLISRETRINEKFVDCGKLYFYVLGKTVGAFRCILTALYL